MGVTKIEWTDYTWNPWRGCSRVSDGCRFCFADAQSKRSPDVLGIWGPPGTGRRVVAAESYWRLPHQWDAKAGKEGVRRRVFCGSLMDVFELWPGELRDHLGRRLWLTPDGIVGEPAVRAAGRMLEATDKHKLTLQHVRMRLLRLIVDTPNLDWLLLTKRPECYTRAVMLGEQDALPRNVWLGTSVEDQAAADMRIPQLLRIPASVRFLSVEPLLGPVDLEPWLHCDGFCPKSPEPDGAYHYDQCPIRSDGSGPKIDWVIVGGESGPNARPCNVEWIRSIVRQSKAAGVPAFVKQLGSLAVEHIQVEGFDHEQLANDGGGFKHPKGGDMSEWPEDLRVREFPGA